MRHSRAAEFDRAAGSSAPGARRWTEVAADPNDPVALARRALTLRAAWRPSVADRATFLEARCRGKVVVDIGCVAHDVARMASPLWLHRRLATAAARCVGVDVDAAGVEAMRSLGFDAIEHDLREGLGPLASLVPVDVIVAGEVIEHVEDVGMLFRAASSALTGSGELIVTTPNPYAPARVRAARRGVVWENVDHILYAFPSGVAELAERYGLVLTEVCDVERPRTRGVANHLRSIRRWLRGRQWRTVGLSSVGSQRVQAVERWWERIWWDRLRRPSRLRGETLVYVVRKAG